MTCQSILENELGRCLSEEEEDFLDFPESTVWNCLQALVAQEDEDGGTAAKNLTTAGTRQCSQCGHFDSEKKQHQACSKCKSAFYCNADCQRVAWKRHKSRCKEGFLGPAL